MERAYISHLVHDRTVVVVTVQALPASAATLAAVLTAVTTTGAVADMLSVSPDTATTVDLRFVVMREEGQAVVSALAAARPRLGCAEVWCDEDVARVTLHGQGMRVDPWITPTFQEALQRVGVPTLTTSTSDRRISAICPGVQLPLAVHALQVVFECAVDPVDRKVGEVNG